MAMILFIPFLLIRFPFLAHFSQNAVSRAAHFAPMEGNEKIAYVVYQISNLGLFLFSCFIGIKFDFSVLFYMGAVIYLLGLTLCAISMRDFARPHANGMNTKGLYRYSRNPMYMAYFICFLGIALLTQSLTFFVILLIFQLSGHWIILAEKRWCLAHFGNSYQNYKKQVRRYFLIL